MDFDLELDEDTLNAALAEAEKKSQQSDAVAAELNALPDNDACTGGACSI